MAVDLSAEFTRFLQNISLGDRQVQRMNSAATTVAGFVTSSYELSTSAIFLQGSYANQTAVEPVEGGEYDVDLVAVCVADDKSPGQALDDLERRFAADGRFKDRIKRKKPCVRIEYAPDDVGKFHVDVVPARVADHPWIAPLAAPRRGEGWNDTAPAEYTEWCRQQGHLFMRTVKILKRWRDEQQGVRTAVRSIVLQVLASGAMPPIADDATRVAQTIRNLHQQHASRTTPPQVFNPVLPSENLAAAWTEESFKSFVRELEEAVTLVDVAAATEDPIEASDAWRELLGDDFPQITPDALGIRLGDWSHAQTPAAKGWSKNLDPRFAVHLEATRQRGTSGRNRRVVNSDGEPVFAGNRLRFKAQVREPVHADIWWQVANTGGHARSVNGLRGDIFKARNLNHKPSRDETENWENTAYTGKHLIRCLLVRDRNVVATSDWFHVNIYAKGHNFRL